MCNILELAGLLVSLGGFVKFFSAWGTEKLLGCLFARGNQYSGCNYGNTYVKTLITLSCIMLRNGLLYLKKLRVFTHVRIYEKIP